MGCPAGLPDRMDDRIQGFNHMNNYRRSISPELLLHVFTPVTIEVLNTIPYARKMTKVLRIARSRHMIEIISASSLKRISAITLATHALQDI
jgi:hypothetical protein